MEQNIKTFKINNINSSLKNLKKLPSLEKISPIKSYTFKRNYEFSNKNLNRNISIDSLFDSTKNLSLKIGKKNKSLFFNDRLKKFDTGDISNMKINKSNNVFFSSYFKKSDQESKNKNIKRLKITLYPGKNKTIFQKIIENIDKIKRNNKKAYEIVKNNEKKTIRLKLKNFTNWRNIRTKPKNEITKVKEESITNSKITKNETTQRANKVIDDVKDTKEPEKIDNDMPLTNSNDVNDLNIVIKEKQENRENQENKDNIENKENKENDIKTNIIINMCHIRNFSISKQQLKNSFNKAGIESKLWRKTLFLKGIEMQMNDIFNKIKLILDNIDYFKVNFFNNGNFYLAFDYMENNVKAEFNLTIEELCFLLIETVPKLLRKFYESLDRFLYVKIPNIEDEMEKNPKNEKECLEFNCYFLNSVSLYFLGCFEVLKEIKKRIDYFQFKNNEFLVIDNYLDLARFNISKINSMAEIYIEKMKKDEKILEKMEMGLGIRKKKKFVSEDIFERIHKRYTQNFKEEMKLERINSTLNLKNNSYLNDEKRNKFILMRRAQNLNLLNQPVIISLMKYLKDNIKSQIISQKVFERFKLKENEIQRKVETKND